MAITQITTQFAGQSDVHPNLVRIISTDDYATVTAPGYLDNVEHEGFIINATDFIFMNYDSGTEFGIFTPSISNGIVTLEPFISEGNVTLPVVDGDFAIFDGTAGTIQDLGYSPSNAAKTKVVMADAATVANHIMVSTDTAGTSGNLTGTAINDGSVQAGRSGVAGSLISYPATATKGSLRLTGVANTGDTITTISNVAMGQATTVSIPDPAGATANFAVAPAALVNNNLVKASGTAGLVADSGIAAAAVQLSANIKAALTANIGGGGAGPIDVTVSGLTSASVVVAVLASSSNPVQVQTVITATNKFSVTFTGDPGATAILNYVAFVAAQ